MTKAILTIILVFNISIIAQPKTVEQLNAELQDCKKNFIISAIKNDSLRNSNNIQTGINTELKALNKKNEAIILNYENQINNLKEEIGLTLMKNTLQEIPLFKWEGFGAGVKTFYEFTSEYISKTTFIEGLKYSIIAEAGFSILGKIYNTISLEIPFSKSSSQLQFKAVYKIF